MINEYKKEKYNNNISEKDFFWVDENQKELNNYQQISNNYQQISNNYQQISNNGKKEISQKIINYALRYYLKYFPSINKLKHKLKEKFGPDSEKGLKYGGIFEDDIEYIIKEKMGDILSEEQIITSKIRNYISRGKNLYYIKSKLREKLFDQEMYEYILRNEFNSDEGTILDYEKIYKQIVFLFKKNKSKNYIRQKFIEREFDRPGIEGILDEVFVGGELVAVEAEFLKIIKAPYFSDNNGDGVLERIIYINNFMNGLDFTKKSKITQKLIGKGFGFGLIKELFEKYEL